jgi:hypothetical protein
MWTVLVEEIKDVASASFQPFPISTFVLPTTVPIPPSCA